jgi:hypothetical protein
MTAIQHGDPGHTRGVDRIHAASDKVGSAPAADGQHRLNQVPCAQNPDHHAGPAIRHLTQ